MDRIAASVWADIEGGLVPLLHDYRERISDLNVREKVDHTLLSDADLAAQVLLTTVIRDHDAHGIILAEEDTGLPPIGRGVPERLWIIDPIDGTREFVSPRKIEYCSVVALYVDALPAAAYILAPELRDDLIPLSIQCDVNDGVIWINGEEGARPEVRNPPKAASLTGTRNTMRSETESNLTSLDVAIKSTTTSQTIDQIRTCIDLREHGALDFPPFDLFYRDDQKIWDGAAGYCLGSATGRTAVDRTGSPLIPLTDAVLHRDPPVFPSALFGASVVVEWFLRVASDSGL